MHAGVLSSMSLMSLPPKSSKRALPHLPGLCERESAGRSLVDYHHFCTWNLADRAEESCQLTRAASDC